MNALAGIALMFAYSALVLSSSSSGRESRRFDLCLPLSLASAGVSAVAMGALGGAAVASAFGFEHSTLSGLNVVLCLGGGGGRTYVAIPAVAVIVAAVAPVAVVDVAAVSLLGYDYLIY